MRLTRLPAALISALLLAGVASCATTIQGSGTIDPGVVNGGSTPDGSADPSSTSDPGESAGSTPTPSPTVSAVQIRERALCVLERAAITGINTSFNKSKQRSQQVQILKQGAATVGGQRGQVAEHESVQRRDQKVPAGLQLDPLSGTFMR